MKKINKIAITILLCTCCNFMAKSQNLNLMPQGQRDSFLIATAKEVVLKYGPDYYREYKLPVIERRQIPPKGEINITGEHVGRVAYWVTFLYDKSKELLDYDYAARVYFWEDTGEPEYVFFGNGWGTVLTEITEGWRNNNDIKMPYQQRGIVPDYDLKTGEILNKETLIKKGYEPQANGQWSKVKPDIPPKY